MPTAWLYAALLLLTARWWGSLLRALVIDLRQAADEPELGSPTPASGPADGRAPPLNRVLAFRGVARRVGARRRWEAGFGRKGL